MSERDTLPAPRDWSRFLVCTQCEQVYELVELPYRYVVAEEWVCLECRKKKAGMG